MTNALVEKITKDTEATVAVIKAAGEAEVAVVQEQTESALETIRATAMTALTKKKAQLELVATSRAKQEGNIALQNAKREQIDTIFTEVFAELSAQSSGEYVSYFVKQCKEVLPKDIEVSAVQAPKGREEETKDILTKIEIKVDAVEIVSDISAGLIIVATDGVYDITLDRMFAEKRDELEMKVVKSLVS